MGEETNHRTTQTLAFMVNDLVLGLGVSEIERVGIHVEFRRSDWIAVVGRSGSGKSTLARALAGVTKLATGTVKCMLEDQPAVQLIMQNPESQMVGETVYEDICFGMENFGVPLEDRKERAEKALQFTGLLSKKDDMTSSLSGGEKQLLTIAGAIALDAPIWILDEPTSMLDPAARERVIHLVRQKQQQGTTVIWMTQLLDELAWADRVIVLEQGSMVFDGDKETFFYSQVDKPAKIKQTYCEFLGFEAPYTVLVARGLQQRGIHLSTWPVSPEQLAIAVGDHR